MTISDAARDRVLRATILAELEAAIARERENYFSYENPHLAVSVTVAATGDDLTIRGNLETLERLHAILEATREH